MNVTTAALKFVVVAHFVLTTWACMGDGFLPLAYTYMNVGLLVFGALCIALPENSDVVLTYLIVHLLSILQDVIFLGIWQPIGYNNWEVTPITAQYHFEIRRNTFRFSLGMAIVNLIIKPLSAFILYRVYQDRGGQYGNLSIPGFPGFSKPGPYEDIDEQPETASPHQSIDKEPPT